MEDNILKKQFEPKDVERIRNLVKGQAGERTTVGTGYNKAKEFHEEGDIWTEGGREWTIKDGLKQNITKLDKARKIHKMPMFCPSCSKLLKENRDRKLYSIHGKCLNCVVDMEYTLKSEGLWEEYVNKINNADLDGLIHMYKTWMFNQINEETNSFISEAGDSEKWEGGVNKERALKALEEGINFLETFRK